MFPRIRSALAGALACLIVGQAAAQIPDDERYIRLGTRLPELPPGAGGQLRVTAPPEWCRDANHLLEVRLFPDITIMQPVVRIPAGPSACDWTFDGLPAGVYGAVIQVQRDERIVATGHGSVWKGAATLMPLESAQTEIEGRLTAREPLLVRLRLRFTPSGSFGEWNRWDAIVSSDGNYHVTLGDVETNTRVCIRAEANGSTRFQTTLSLNSVLLTCASFSRGQHRLDFNEVDLPPAVIEIEVAGLDDSRIDAVAYVSVDAAEFLTSFKLRRGFRGQYLAKYGAHTVTILANGSKEVLASSSITLGPERRIGRVALTVPAPQ